MMTGTDAGVPVTIRFVARVGTQPFTCGSTYAGLGTTQTQYQPKDLRFYVHNLTLTAHDGTTVPFTLTNDGAFQNDGVALLDFEDATGLCSNGTPATHTELTGTVPTDAHFHSLQFTLGVPFAKNHQDATAARPPLDSSGLWWNWNAGYRFIRIDGNTTGQPNGFSFHVGSTGCSASPLNPNDITSCVNPNRAQVTLGFDPDTTKVRLDLKTLFDTSNLDGNAPNTAAGCMAEVDDPDCAPLFKKLGLPFLGVDAGAATLFDIE